MTEAHPLRKPLRDLKDSRHFPFVELGPYWLQLFFSALYFSSQYFVSGVINTWCYYIKVIRLTLYQREFSTKNKNIKKDSLRKLPYLNLHKPCWQSLFCLMQHSHQKDWKPNVDITYFCTGTNDSDTNRSLFTTGLTQKFLRLAGSDIICSYPVSNLVSTSHVWCSSTKNPLTHGTIASVQSTSLLTFSGCQFADSDTLPKVSLML